MRSHALWSSIGTTWSLWKLIFDQFVIYYINNFHNINNIFCSCNGYFGPQTNTDPERSEHRKMLIHLVFKAGLAFQNKGNLLVNLLGSTLKNHLSLSTQSLTSCTLFYFKNLFTYYMDVFSACASVHQNTASDSTGLLL